MNDFQIIEALVRTDLPPASTMIDWQKAQREFDLEKIKNMQPGDEVTVASLRDIYEDFKQHCRETGKVFLIFDNSISLVPKELCKKK